jgi:predicted Fe-S protein YdhL (DUF1289 family)
MANAAALIQESLWRNNRDFRALPRVAQCTYVQLCSTRDLDCAGQITLNVGMLAKACDEVTADDLASDLKTLEAARFVFVDEDTDELLIRSYLRLVSARSPNAYKAALKAAKLVNSPKLRHELAIELRRIGKADATAIANDIDPADIPSEPHPNPIGNPSERGIPSEPHAEPPVSVPVRYQSSPSVVGYVERAPDPEPPTKCQRHRGVENPPGCIGCQRAREAHEAWDGRQELARRRALADLAQRKRDCPDCDDWGRVEFVDEDGTESLRECPNNHDGGES